MSGCMALSVMAVSIRVSPFFRDELPTGMFITSAPSRLPASSNEDWVRVDASKNRLIRVRPRNEVRFFSIWRFSSTYSSARSSSPLISSAESPSMPSRCRRLRTNEVFGAMFIKATPIGGVGWGRQGRLGRGPQALRRHGKMRPGRSVMTVQARFETHEILNQSPPYEDVDLFASDRALREAVETNGAGAEAAALSQFGRHWGAAAMF